MWKENTKGYPLCLGMRQKPKRTWQQRTPYQKLLLPSFQLRKVKESESEFAQSCLTLCDPWTIAHEAPLSMGFSRQEYWSGLPFPSPGDLPDPDIEPGSPALQADALPSEPPTQEIDCYKVTVSTTVVLVPCLEPFSALSAHRLIQASQHTPEAGLLLHHLHATSGKVGSERSRD